MHIAPITYAGPGRIVLDLPDDEPPAGGPPGQIGLGVAEPIETLDFVDAAGIWLALHTAAAPHSPVLVGPRQRRRRLATVLRRHLGVNVVELPPGS